VGGDVLILLFSNFLYAFRPCLLHSTTCLTVLLARERFTAVRHPLAYRAARAAEGAGGGWRRAAGYAAASFVASLMLVAPLFWESRVREVELQVRKKKRKNFLTTYKESLKMKPLSFIYTI
jgi:hypothetical protein